MGAVHGQGGAEAERAEGDLAVRHAAVVRSVSDEIRKILAYFGVNGDARPLVGMIADRDLKMLLDAGMAGGDIDHCLRVADKALEIAGRMELSGARRIWNWWPGVRSSTIWERSGPTA
jgi:plasmid stability protein